MNSDSEKKSRGTVLRDSHGSPTGIYQDPRTGNFYHRPKINGKPTWRKLPVANLTVAKKLKDALDSKQALFEAGLEKDPYASPAPTVGVLMDAFEAAGYPTVAGHAREGEQIRHAKQRLVRLRSFWAPKQCDQIKPGDCSAYFERRKGADGRGGREVDLELCLMSNLYRWAYLQGKVESNPFTIRPKFRAKVVRHCRESMPADATELHALARVLFEDPGSEVLGWQLLFEAMTGCRTNEVLKLRWDAKSRYEPGFIEGEWLWLNRSKKGINPFVQIHPALKELLAQMRQWHQAKHPESPWFFPGKNPGQPSSTSSLTCALRRIAKLVGQGRRTSHGLRAYYVTVRRSQGISDAQIAAEIGDKSGAAIIVHTYGAIPPNWYGSVQMDWMTKEPAWAVLGMAPNVTTLPNVTTTAS